MTAQKLKASDLHMGTPIYSSDGQKVGLLRFVILDPESCDVRQLVIEKGMTLERDAVAPVTALRAVRHSGLFLNLTANQVAELPEFAEQEYLQRDGAGGGGRKGRRRRRGRRGGED